MEDIVNGFSSSEEEIEDILNENLEPLAINPSDYEELKIIQWFQIKGLLITEIRCEICHNKMKFEKKAQYFYNYVWRCRSLNPSHDIKLNIRTKSLFADIRIPLNVIYYLTFKYFITKMSINKTTVHIKEFCATLGLHHITNKLVIKLFRILRNKIKIAFHAKWRNSPLGLEPAENGHPSVEINISSIIGNGNTVIWAFGIIDR